MATRRLVGLIGLVLFASVAVGVLLASGDNEPDEGSWLLPTVLFEEVGQAGFASEAGPGFWPTTQTISLWRSGEDWVVVHSYPLSDDNLLGTLPWLSLVLGETILGETESTGGSPGEQLESPSVERWVYASESMDSRSLAAFVAGLWDDPHPDAIEPPINAFASDLGDYDPELRAAVEAFELAQRVTLESDSRVGLVQASSSSSDFGVIALAVPIPLAVIPFEAEEVVAEKDYEIHEFDGRSLIVRDGGVYASIGGSEEGRRRATLSMIEVDDLPWGELAWPRLAAFLRLADLDADATAGDDSCSAVMTLDGGCLQDVTPEAGFVWVGDGPSLAREGSSWTVVLPVENVGLEPGDGSRRLGVVRQNQILLAFDLADVPGEVEATTATRREALRLMKMLYPDEPLPD